MNTTASYQGTILKHSGQNEKLKNDILEYCPAKKIYLLGITRQTKKTETLFSVHGVSTTWTSHYYVLILIEKTNETSLCAMQDKIENHLQHAIPLTTIMLYIQEFSQWLLDGHPFANAVCQKALLLYSDEESPLPFPKPVNEEALAKENQMLFTQTQLKLHSFLAGAELYTIRKEYGLAAFMLHQAAEQSLRTMLTVNTGLKINTHSIDKLLRYCSMFCYHLPEIFPRNNEKEKHLFTLLNKAYIDSRYNQYTISYEDLSRLTEKLKMIKQCFESYKTKTNSNP